MLEWYLKLSPRSVPFLHTIPVSSNVMFRDDNSCRTSHMERIMSGKAYLEPQQTNKQKEEGITTW